MFERVKPEKFGSKVVLICGLIFTGFILAGIVFYLMGYRQNTTDSFPRGFYKISKIEGAPEVGRLVFVCPPNSAVFKEARKREYINRGTCKGNYAPLLKRIVAREGAVISVQSTVTIDGIEQPNSNILTKDGLGRPMPKYEGGIVEPGQVILMSDYNPYSFDSRYFGPLFETHIIGYAHPISTN